MQITAEELKKLLEESFLSAELKASYAELLGEMTDDEKTQLVSILEQGKKAKADFDKNRIEQLARLNRALEKHLKDVSHEEGKYARDQFESMGRREDEQDLKLIEEQITKL